MLLKAYEQLSLWMGGTYEFFMQLVTFLKHKCYLCACLIYCVLIYLFLIWVNFCMLSHISNCCYSV
jgi:hypothetical protein